MAPAAEGLAAVEVAKALGRAGDCTAGPDEKLEMLAAAGRSTPSTATGSRTAEAVLEITQKHGADVVYDPVGGLTFDIALRCIAPEGRITLMGFAGDHSDRAGQYRAGQEHRHRPGHLLGYYRLGPPAGAFSPTTRGCALPMRSFRVGDPGKACRLVHAVPPLSGLPHGLEMIALARSPPHLRRRPASGHCPHFSTPKETIMPLAESHFAAFSPRRSPGPVLAQDK